VCRAVNDGRPDATAPTFSGTIQSIVEKDLGVANSGAVQQGRSILSSRSNVATLQSALVIPLVVEFCSVINRRKTLMGQTSHE
jgi:nucleoside diphosphate kinase